ncbi:MAG: LysR family transcriptional regulator [Anaerolineae bacterium]|nr:LysR family transcriptional regulator [Anaerolineae bacterium]
MLDLYKLQVFLTAARAGSFSAAAERLYVTQPAVSQHVGDLEALLGRTLFVRGRRGVSLTPHGQRLAEYAERIFALVGEAEAALTDVSRITEGRVALGATPGIAIYLAPDWITRFRGRYPHLSVALQTGVTREILQAVLGGRIDIGLIEGELDPLPDPRLAVETLQEVEQVVVVGRKHPLWGAEEVPLSALDRASLIARTPGSQTRAWLDAALKSAGVQPMIAAEFDQIEAIKRAVGSGMCLTIMPVYAVQSEVEQGTLRTVRIAGAPLIRRLKVIYDSSAPLTPVAGVFVTMLRDMFADQGSRS